MCEAGLILPHVTASTDNTLIQAIKEGVNVGIARRQPAVSQISACTHANIKAHSSHPRLYVLYLK